MDIVAIIVQLIIVAGTLGGALLVRRRTRAEAKHEEGDGAQAISSAAATMVTTLEQRVKTLEAERAGDRAKIDALTCEVEALRKQLAQTAAVVEILSNQVIMLGSKPMAGPKAASG